MRGKRNCNQCQRCKELEEKILHLEENRDIEIARGYHRERDIIGGLLRENEALHRLLQERTQNSDKECKGCNRNTDDS